MVNGSNIFKINPDNGVEAIKRNAKSTLNSVLAGDRMVRLMEASSCRKGILFCR
jgi:hypothetical protein